MCWSSASVRATPQQEPESERAKRPAGRAAALRPIAPPARGRASREEKLMRVVGGRLRGRALAPPKSQAIRPTADRLREVAVQHPHARLRRSRQRRARARSLCRHRRARHRSGLARRRVCAVHRRERGGARAACARTSPRSASAAPRAFFAATPPSSAPPIRCAPFSLVFLDPPYGRGLAAQALAAARAGGWLAPEALIVVEEAVKPAFAAPEGFTEIERRRYDDTEFIFLRPI